MISGQKIFCFYLKLLATLRAWMIYRKTQDSLISSLFVPAYGSGSQSDDDDRVINGLFSISDVAMKILE
jgi:hypothetical protein